MSGPDLPPGVTPINKARKKRQPTDAPAWENILGRLAAQSAYAVNGVHAVELALTAGGRVAFLADADGDLCAGVISDHADPELKKWLGAEMEKLGLPMFSCPEEKAAESMAELTRLLEKKSRHE